MSRVWCLLLKPQLTEARHQLFAGGHAPRGELTEDDLVTVHDLCVFGLMGGLGSSDRGVNDVWACSDSR